MDNNDSNTKSQQTGGLKLMTVFIAVLALHVVVIGGFTVYHLMSGGSTDADLTIDKSKKDMKSADTTSTAGTTTPDASQSDKTAPAATSATTDVATAPATTPTPDATSASEIVPPTPGPAPTLTPTPVATTPAASTPVPPTPAPLTLSPTDLANAGKLEPLAPLTSNLAPVAPAASMTPDASLTSPPLTSALASGPVHMPPAAKAPSPTHVDGPTYTVKITDSYKKIASAHHITVAQLKAANHIKGDTLHTGEKLIIPAGKTMVATAAPVTHTDLKPVTSSLIESTASPTASLAASPAYTATTVSGAAHEHTYTIVKGDTLGKIAHKFKTTTAAIMTENNITDPTKLTIGKKLRIPSKESRSAGNTVPAATPTIQPQVQPQPPQPQVETKSDDPTAQLANFKGSADTNF